MMQVLLKLLRLFLMMGLLTKFLTVLQLILHTLPFLLLLVFSLQLLLLHMLLFCYGFRYSRFSPEYFCRQFFQTVDFTKAVLFA